MKPKLLTILLILTLTSVSYGQTIQEIFLTLPLDYTPELTKEAKDSLIHKGTYTSPGGDSLETMKVDYSPESDYIKLHYYFTTGQSGFIIIELKKIKKPDGSAVVVYSRFNGARRAYDQYSLLSFDYIKGSFRQVDLGLPETITTREFLKDNLPDSLRADEITLNTGYNLNPKEKNSIEYLIDQQTYQYDDLLDTRRIQFTWNGERFETESGLDTITKP